MANIMLGFRSELLESLLLLEFCFLGGLATNWLELLTGFIFIAHFNRYGDGSTMRGCCANVKLLLLLLFLELFLGWLETNITRAPSSKLDLTTKVVSRLIRGESPLRPVTCTQALTRCKVDDWTVRMLGG